MTGQTSICRALCMVAIVLPLAAAQGETRPGAIRTYVSGLGDDANTATFCPRQKPCRTLAAANTVTNAGGEIIALDPADYGPITITGALSIFGTQNALIGVASNGTGVTITAGAADKVVIRDFTVSGAGAADTKGIQLNSGQLTLSHSTLKQLSTALDVVSSKADVVATDIVDNDTGVATTGTGVDINVFPMTGPTQVRIAWGNTSGNNKAYVMNDPGAGTNSTNKVSILEFVTSNTDAAYSTNITGNATVVSGTGPSCAGPYNCQSLGDYGSYTDPR